MTAVARHQLLDVQSIGQPLHLLLEIHVSSSGNIEPHALDAGEFVDGSSAQAASESRLLHAAVRHTRIDAQIGVDPNGAGIEPLCSTMGAADITRPYTGGQAVVAVISDRISLLLGVEG